MRLTACLMLGALVLASATPCLGEALSPAATQLFKQAGNTEDETERLHALQKLAESKELAPSLREEAGHLSEFVRRWNEPPLPAYYSQLDRKAASGVYEYDFKVAQDSPLRPIAELYRGRMLAWGLLEDSRLKTDLRLCRLFTDEAIRSFRVAAAAFPENRIPRMYLGESIPWPRSYSDVPGAPTWAVLQREHQDRFREIIRWWIEHRQLKDGSFGGGWGDDVEMWRWWAPVLLGFNDPDIVAAQVRLSKSSLERPEVSEGYLATIDDVEHSNEDTTDSLTPLLALQPGAPDWERQAANLIKLMQRVWTGQNDRGALQFKGYYFGASQVDPRPDRGFDVIANVLAVKPALLTWLRTRDPELSRPLTAWLDTWIEATARAENGKPAGILPASLRWPDGQVAGAGDRWWEPVQPGGNMFAYYAWPSVMTELTDALLVAHIVTGEQKYLAPIRSMAAIRLNHLKHPPTGTLEPGTEAWCAELLGARPSSADSPVQGKYGALVKTLARCKALIGTREFDELITREGGVYSQSVGAPDHVAFEKALLASLEALRVNYPAYTSEVRWTDRVLSFVMFLAPAYKLQESKVNWPNADLVYRMVTGDTNDARFPLMAVRWQTPSDDIAAWVTEATLSRFQAELFHFGEKPRKMAAELRLLKPGAYRVELLQDGRPVGTGASTLEIKAGFTVVPLELPPQKLCVLRITPREAPGR